MPKLPQYYTPENFRCPECGQPCTIIALENDFSYAGTHCTYGLPGTHYPDDWGAAISNCCEAYVDDAEVEEPDWDTMWEAKKDKLRGWD